MLKKPMRICTI